MSQADPSPQWWLILAPVVLLLSDTDLWWRSWPQRWAEPLLNPPAWITSHSRSRQTAAPCPAGRLSNSIWRETPIQTRIYPTCLRSAQTCLSVGSSAARSTRITSSWVSRLLLWRNLQVVWFKRSDAVVSGLSVWILIGYKLTIFNVQSDDQWLCYITVMSDDEGQVVWRQLRLQAIHEE